MVEVDIGPLLISLAITGSISAVIAVIITLLVKIYRNTKPKK